MRKWILMLVCVLTLSALSVCFAEDSDNSGEVTAQQSYVNEAITAVSYTHLDVYKRQIHSHITAPFLLLLYR